MPAALLGMHCKSLKDQNEIRNPDNYNPIALRMANTLWSFGCSECNRVKAKNLATFLVIIFKGKQLEIS